jgi:uncharacterized DUF497 family protein
VSIKFEWNPNEAAQNIRKHKVSFEEAATVFRDTLSIAVLDPDHSIKDRCITIGLSSWMRLLMVAHTDREDCIRIISARELTRRERKQYEEGN